MITTVVLPLDGSERAEAALAPTRELSTRLGVPVVLFRAAGDDRDEVQAYLDRTARRLDGRPVRSVVHHGFESRALAETVRGLPGAAVCMTPGLAAPDTELIGSVAEDVIEAGDAPVVLVGPAYAPGSGLTDGGRGLVLCADGSAGASAIEPVVADWADALGLEVRLVTVLRHDEPALAGVPVERIVREVDHLAFRLARRGVPVHVDVLDDGLDPAFAITQHAARHPTAMVAASVRGHRHSLHSVLGQTVLHIVRLSPVPVLVSQPVGPALHS